MDGFCDLEEEGQSRWLGPWFCSVFFLWWVVVATVVVVVGGALVGVLICRGCRCRPVMVVLGGLHWLFTVLNTLFYCVVILL